VQIPQSQGLAWLVDGGQLSSMIEISIYRALFLPQMFRIIINQYYSQPTTPTPVYFSISTASA
jgi:hypothetical protein